MPRRLLLACFLPLLLLILLIAGPTAYGDVDQDQPAANAIDPDRANPQAAMFAFLDAMNAIESGERRRWPVVYALLGESDPPPTQINTLRRHAFNLKQTLDYIGEVKPEEFLTDLPAETDYFVYFPQVYNPTHQQAVEDIGRDDLTIPMVRGEGGWSFMVLTEEFAQLHRLLLEHREQQFRQDEADKGEGVLARHMPQSLKEGELVGVYYWQWVSLAVLILLGVVIDHALRAVLRGVVSRRVRGSGEPVERDQINRTVRPCGFVAGGVLVMFGLSLMGLPEMAYRVLFGAAAIFTVLAGVLAAWQLIDLVAMVAASHAERTKTKFDDILIPMVRKAAKIFAVAIGIVYAAQALNLPIVPLLGSLGIGSLAFAFAAKDTIENFFGSVAVILDRPFEVGDWVVFDNKTEGTVEELGFRSTRIRTFYNSQITVPNSTLVRATVDNYGRRKYRRWKTHVGVQYDTPPDKLIAFTEGIRELVRKHPYTRKDYYQVWMHQWSASSMDVLLYIFFEVPDWSTELRERERLFVDIVRLADALGVQFAFPTQTVHLYKEEHAAYEPHHETPGQSTDRRSLVQGIRAARELVSNQPWLDNPPGAVSYSFDGADILLDEAGNETLVDKDNKTEPTGDQPEPEEPPAGSSS
ncbi:MAG: mechanosensitive ion channel family protein [Planctomycetota bacterium]